MSRTREGVPSVLLSLWPVTGLVPSLACGDLREGCRAACGQLPRSRGSASPAGLDSASWSSPGNTSPEGAVGRTQLFVIMKIHGVLTVFLPSALKIQGKYIFDIYWVPEAILRIFYTLTHLIIRVSLWGRYYYSHFTFSPLRILRHKRSIESKPGCKPRLLTTALYQQSEGQTNQRS